MHIGVILKAAASWRSRKQPRPRRAPKPERSVGRRLPAPPGWRRPGLRP
jgi:hypothetical protein